MAIDTLILLISLFMILLAAVLFTNAVEWLGKRLKLAEGTALPETLIPVVAILLQGRGGSEKRRP